MDCYKTGFIHEILFVTYRNDPKYWGRQAWANNVDPDQSDQSLHSLLLIQPFLDTSTDS